MKIYEPICNIPKLKDHLLKSVENYITHMGRNAIRDITQTETNVCHNNSLRIRKMFSFVSVESKSVYRNHI